MQNTSPESIEHRRNLAKAMREAGATFELIAEVLRNSTGNTNTNDNRRDSVFAAAASPGSPLLHGQK